MIINPDHSIDEIKENINAVMKMASEDTIHPFRLFSAATYDSEKNLPESRMVVLREFLPDWTIRFYTDHRSQKVKQLRENPNLALLFWSADMKLQIRMHARSTIHYQNQVSKENWRQIGGHSTRSYTTQKSPGTAIGNSGISYEYDTTLGDRHFCVIDACPLQIKTLELQKPDHLAIEFNRKSASQDWEGKWIVP